MSHAGWQWIFWFLTLASGACLLLIILFLPETSRFIVGNGSRKVSALHRPLSSCLRMPYQRQARKDLEKGSKNHADEPPKKAFHIPNPLTSLKILFAKDAVCITLIYGIFYMNFSCLQASMSTLVIGLYGYSEIKAGLLYLPFGIGSIVGAYCSGTALLIQSRFSV